jgi:hypothetical protein
MNGWIKWRLMKNTAKEVLGKMIQYAINHLKLQQIACVTVSDVYQYSLTSDGERLIASCLRRKIITPDMCFFSTLSDVNPAGSEILSGDGDDPGYNSGIVMGAVALLDASAAIPNEADLESSDSDGIRAGTRKRLG